MLTEFPPKSWRIETPRLVIRTPEPADATAMVEVLSNPANLPMGETKAPPRSTEEKVRERLERWCKLAVEGRMVTLVVALRDQAGGAGDGAIVGYMGFNCFRTRGELEGTEPERQDPTPGLEGRYMTDLGVTIDHAHQRRGYSTEVVCASTEFAFEEVGCQVVRLETALLNEPWRALMRFMGLGGLEEKATVSFGDKSEGYIYKVDKAVWQKAKAELKEKGKWPLE